nr:MAG TPA: hypothetical protein [Caudoviricetes sp.]
MKNELFYHIFLVFAKLEKILGKYKKLCRYCEGEDSYLFWPPPVLFGKLKIFLRLILWSYIYTNIWE